MWTFMKRRAIRKYLKGFRFDMIESYEGKRWEDYRNGGEWTALCWLKAYTEKKTVCEPEEFLMSCLDAIYRLCLEGADLKAIKRYSKEGAELLKCIRSYNSSMRGGPEFFL